MKTATSIVLLAAACAANGAVWPPSPAERDVPGLLRATALVRSLDEDALRRMVPVQSGLFYVGCANCRRGHQERQLVWTPEKLGEVSCRYCGHRYPSAQYPMDKSLEVRNPRGEIHTYPYWENDKGYRYFFAARRDDEVKDYLARQARSLALLYVATGKEEYSRRAALLLRRFAEVFPGWCYHYDYPFQQKQVFEGAVPAEKFLPGFRTARWTWWAYSDLPLPLLEAYDWIRDSGALGPDAKATIERDLFRNVAAQLLGNRDPNSNMSPRLWGSLVRLGRVLAEPRYVDESMSRLRALLAERFYYDGSWAEGAPSYARQTVGSVRHVLELRGDAAMPPELRAAEAALQLLRLPNGRPVPVHDTWSTDRAEALEKSAPFLLPALGHAALAGGEGPRQWQLHLTWSGGYGHEHADGLSLLLYARGRELLSDLGYTHTKFRAWTLATAAHNTVAIDERNQETKAADGALRFFDTSHPRVQAVSVDNTRAYPDVAKKFRRTLVAVDGRYVVDWFEVEGGAVHDYFLHGDADRAGAVTLPLPATPVAPPAGWVATANEGEVSMIRRPGYAYGFLRDQREARLAQAAAVPVAMPEGLRVCFLAEAGDRLFTGTNPSIRNAAEDDAELDKHQRGFFRARREGGRSVFAAVFEIASGVQGAERTARGIRVKLADRTDEIEIGETGVRVPSLNYATAPPRGATLRAIEGGRFLSAGPDQPPPGGWMRLVTPDGWVYPVRHEHASAFTWDAASRTLRLLRFPTRAHAGETRLEWR